MANSQMYRRRFLNRPGHFAGAHVIARVRIRRPRKGKRYVVANLTLADCERAIELCFFDGDQSDRGNALFKARLLRDVLAEFCTTLEAAYAEIPSADNPDVD